MNNFLVQNLKRSLTYFLILSLTTSFFPSQSYAGYGISIDIEDRNLSSPAVRVLFLNIDEQKVEEVNYYSVLDQKGLYRYMIPTGVQHNANPVIGFIFNNKILEDIIIKDDFTTDNYTVISKFPLRTLSSIVYPPTAGYCYYKVIDAPRNLSDLTTKKTPKKHKPAFHYVIPNTNTINRSEFLETALGGDAGKATRYTQHKEKLGEYATLLTLLEYGYTKIYDTKLGQTGMDFMVFSGEDPSKDTFLLVESKWTSNKDASLTQLHAELNSEKIISRLRILLQATTPELVETIKLVRTFFNTPNTKTYKFFYKIFDNKNQMRGVAKPVFELLNEQERSNIGTATGIIKPLLRLNIMKSPDTLEPLPNFPQATLCSASVTSQDDLLPFIGLLKEARADLAPLWSFLKESYSMYYEEFSKGNRHLRSMQVSAFPFD